MKVFEKSHRCFAPRTGLRRSLDHLSDLSLAGLRVDVWRRLPGRSTLTLDGSRFSFLAPEINNYGVRVTWRSADERTAVSLWGENLGDEFDWKNIGPPIGFHFNQGSAPRGYSGRSRAGVTANFSF